MLSSIHRFVLRQCSLLTTEAHPRVLDYGCGAGEIVEAGMGEGLDIYGVEIFYEGGNTRETVEAKGLLGSRVKELLEGEIPFPAASFDVVVANQVFEHVPDMERALSEISRVLDPGGAFLCLFPSSEVIREGHCGIPFVHWFPRESNLRYPYTLLLRSLGLGYFKSGKSRRRWSRDFLHWLDDFTFYRSRAEILNAFQDHFGSVSQIENVYMAYRLEDRRQSALSRVAVHAPLNHVSRWLCRKLSGQVLVARRPRRNGAAPISV